MNKKLLLPLMGVAAVGCAEQEPAIPVQPNILWIMAEDMGQDLECYGMSAVSTPNLNLMASQGVKYNAAVCSNPISSPNRSAMITGATQVVTNSHNHRSNRNTPIDTTFVPFTKILRDNGYTTILGNHSVMKKGRKMDFNFKHDAVGSWDGVENFGVFDKLDEFTAEDQPFFNQVQLIVTHRGDWWNEVTNGAANPVNPAEVVLPPFMPDHPQVRKEWASYLDQVEFMDNEVGMLMEELKQKGLLDNTIVFFIGDNGRCDIKGKGYLYEPGLKIPMIAWGKGIKPSEVNNVVSVLDITATILDLAGCQLPAYCEGKPLFDKTSGESVASHAYVYSARDTWDEVVECCRAVTTVDYKYIRNYFPQVPWDAHQQYLDFHRPTIHIMRTLKKMGKLTDDQMKFMADSKPSEELYDLKNDPFELNNLAADPAFEATLASMRSKMEEWQKNHVDLGLADRNDRHPEEMGTVREYVKKVYPDKWKYIEEGNIIDFYQQMNKEAREAAKKAAQKSSKKGGKKK